jgi:hypothetical protein
MRRIIRRYRHLRLTLLSSTFPVLCACSAGWHRIQPAVPSSLPEGQQVQVWHDSTRAQLHAVRVDRDSISGVPFQKPRECDSCRIGFPTTSVDSLRAGNPTAAFLKSIALTLGSWLALGLLTYGVGGD